MCLDISNDTSYKIAAKDIVCYKVLMDFIDDKYRLTCFRGEPMKKNMTSDLRVFHNEVQQGLHTFANKKNAKKIAAYYYTNNNPHYVIKCIIPKGTKYFKGTFLDNRCLKVNSYASERITVVSWDKL